LARKLETGGCFGVERERREGQAESHGKDVGVLREELRVRSPEEVARRAGARLCREDDSTSLSLPYWDREVLVGFPGITVRYGDSGREVDDKTEQLIVHYLHTADGSAGSGTWVSLAELPDGSFYRNAYQGYSGDHLALMLEDDLDSLRRAAVSLGGRPEGFGDLSFSFEPLPRLSLLLVYWRSDEEFPPSSQVHFSDSASHCLPTDLCASLGRLLVDKLLAARESG
jgi:hypothetical protein